MGSMHPVQVIAVTGGKGGVGKTNVSVNLSLALADLGRRVMLMDADLGLANVDVLLGLTPKRTLADVINGECDLKDVLLQGPGGIRIVPAASGTQSMVQLSPVQHAGLIQAFSDISDNLDVLVIDTAAGIGDGVVSFVRAAQEVLVVVCDEPTSITDAYALIKKVSLGYARRRFRLLVNKGRSAAEAEAIHRNMAQVSQGRGLAHLAYAGFVPLDEQLRQALRLSQPVAELFPEAPAARACQGIARSLLDWPLPEQNAGGLEHFVQHLLHLSQHIDPVPIYA